MLPGGDQMLPGGDQVLQNGDQKKAGNSNFIGGLYYRGCSFGLYIGS